MFCSATYYTNFFFFSSGANAGNASLPDIAGGQVGGGSVANLPALDMQWVESRAKKAALKLEKLDTDLKNSKVRMSSQERVWMCVKLRKEILSRLVAIHLFIIFFPFSFRKAFFVYVLSASSFARC